MQYMLLIYGNEGDEARATEAQGREVFAAYMKYTEDLRSAGVLVAGDPLQPTTTSTTVRVRGGETTMTDGPFAETKEQLGGYYLIDVPNLDDALQWASKCPGAWHGSVEVRPIMSIG